MISSLENKLAAIGFSADKNSLRPILKGGSMRAFFRFKSQNKPYIFCEYSDQKEENFLYADIAKFLKSSGVNVCDIAYENRDMRIIVMSDLGECDLLDFAKSSSASDTLLAYQNALKEAHLIHTRATKNFALSPIKLMPSFDENLYIWEQNYFYENFICKHLKLEISVPDTQWRDLRKLFLAQAQCLLHRDFQSQNIIVNTQTLQTGLIDFQGMRMGVCWYDIGSILFDPYAKLPPEMQSALFKFYCEISKLDPEKNKALFFKISAQRLMQALGAYAFLANKKGKLEYLKFMRPALLNLIFCAQNAEIDETLKLAQSALLRLESLA